MKIIEIAIKRPIGTCTLFLILIIFGVISLTKLKVSMLPDINYPKLTIITLFQNVPPKEIENLITSPIEEAVMSVKGVKSVQSISRQGISIVVPVFRWGTDIDIASVNVREKLDMIKNVLPDEVSKPVISRIDPSSSPIIGLGVFWENRDPVFIRNLIEKEIKPELERIDGVAKVSIKGGVEEEIRITVDLDKMNAYKISLQDIINSLKNASYNFPAGDIIEGKNEYLIRVDGEFKKLEDIKSVIIGRSENGGVVQVGDVADVYSGIKERTSYFLLDGREGVGLEITKESNGNDIEISKNVISRLKLINEKFESLLNIQKIYDSSQFISDSIKGLFISGLLAVLITFAVVLVFMKSYKLPLIIIITVPISILITFIFMFLTKMSLNIMSLGGLALGIGMLVDSSIVVIEEIEGKSDVNLIYQAIQRIALSVFASTFTTIVVFVPLIFVKGIAGALFGQLALTITYSLLASIIVSMFLIPVLYRLMAKGEKGKDPLWYLNFRKFFKKQLFNNLKKRKIIMALSAVFFILAVIAFFIVRKEFMPVVDTGEFFIKISYKSGTAIEDSRKYTAELSRKLKDNINIMHTFASVGYDSSDPFSLLKEEIGVNIAEIRVLLKDKRKGSVFKIVDDISKSYRFREDVNLVFEIPRNVIADILNLEKSDFSTEIYCLNDDKVDEKAFKYKEMLEKSGLLFNVETSKKEGKPQIRVSFDNEALAGIGISSKSIYDLMSTAINGSKAAAFRRDDDQIDIKVILNESDRSEFNDISRLNLNTEEGQIPIFPFIINEKVTSPSKILRKNQKEYIKFSGNFKKSKEKGLKEIGKINVNFMKNNAGTIISGGENQAEMQESFNQLIFAFFLSLFLVFAILASQFESLLRPLLIMFTVPLSFFGSLFLLIIFNKSININSIIGIVMLGGIVVNNAIILFERFNFNSDVLKMKPVMTVYYGSLNRFKPVLMTTGTTVIGLLPMAIGIGRGAELQRSLAISVIGGLTLSTVLTLFLMPVLYNMTQIRKDKNGKKIK